MPFNAGAIYTQLQMDLAPFNKALASAFNEMPRTVTTGAQRAASGMTLFNAATDAAEKKTNLLTAATNAGNLGFGKMALAMGLANVGMTLLTSTVSKLVGMFHEGIAASAGFEQATIRLAQSIQDSHPEIPYARANEMAKQFVDTSRTLAAQIGVSADEVNGITRGIQEFSIGVNLASKQGQADFQALLMSLKTYHAGADLAGSSTRELNALFNELASGAGGGAGGAFTAMATRLKEMDPLIHDHVKAWRATEMATGNVGFTLGQLAKMMAGVNAAIEVQKGSYEAIQMVLKNTVDQILREGFKPVVADIGAIMAKISEYVKAHRKDLEEGIVKAWNGVKAAAEGLWDAVQRVYSVLSFKIAGTSIGYLLFILASEATAVLAVAKMMSVYMAIQKMATSLQIPVGVGTVGAALLALALLAPIAGNVGEMLGSRPAGASMADVEGADAANRKRFGLKPGEQYTGTTPQAPASAAVLPGAALGGETKFDIKAHLEEVKKAEQLLREETVRTMEAQAAQFTVQGRTLQGGLMQMQANYQKVALSATATVQDVTAAQEKGAAEWEKIWLTSFEKVKQGLAAYKAEYASVTNEILGYTRELAQLEGEDKGESKADVLRDEAAAVEKMREDQNLSIQERIKAGGEEVNLDRQRLTEAQRTGVGITEAQRALNAARQAEILLLREGLVAAKAKQAEDLAAINDLLAAQKKLAAAWTEQVDSIQEQVRKGGHEVLRQWAEELPRKITDSWSRMNLRQYMPFLPGDLGGGGGAPLKQGGGTTITGDVYVTIPGTGMSVGEIATAVHKSLTDIQRSTPQPPE